MHGSWLVKTLRVSDVIIVGVYMFIMCVCVYVCICVCAL